MEKENVAYNDTMEYYSAIQKKKILALSQHGFVTTWMHMEDIMLSEIGQAGKSKSCLLSLICRINLVVNFIGCAQDGKVGKP